MTEIPKIPTAIRMQSIASYYEEVIMNTANVSKEKTFLAGGTFVPAIAAAMARMPFAKMLKMCDESPRSEKGLHLFFAERNDSMMDEILVNKYPDLAY